MWLPLAELVGAIFIHTIVYTRFGLCYIWLLDVELCCILSYEWIVIGGGKSIMALRIGFQPNAAQSSPS